VDLSSLGAAVVMVMFGYSGWNAAAYVAEEVRDPKRNIPSALLLGTSGVIVAYLLVNVAYFGGAPWVKLTGQIAVAEVAASETLGTVGSSFLTLLILSSILSSLTAMSIAGPRVYFAMSRDKLFPGWLSHVDPKRKLPIKAICFQSVIALILIAVARFGEILLYAGTILILFTTLTVSVLLTCKRVRRGVASWVLYRLLPSVFVLTNIAVLVTAAYSRWQEALAGVATVAAGLPVYWYYKSRKGAQGLANEEPRNEPAQM
jgi:APA family basic amino acid/polyamine antiporter